MIAVPYGDDVASDDAKTLYYMLSALPILCAVSQLAALMFCFPNDTPIVMMQNKEEEKVHQFMTRLYNDE